MSDSFIIFPSDQQWRLGLMDAGRPLLLDVPVPAERTPRVIAENLATLLQSRGYRGQEVVLAIPAAWCLAVPIDIAHLPTRPSRQEMLYLLEERLPAAAEDVAADFLVGEKRVFAVAALTQPLRPLLEAMETRGIAVGSIQPLSLLVLQHELDGGDDAILRAGEENMELFLLEDGRPIAWHLLDKDGRGAALLVRAAMLRGQASLRIAVDDAPAEIRSELSGIPGVTLRDVPRPALPLAAIGAVATGRFSPWIDLRRDALDVGNRYRSVDRPLSLAVAAAMLLCVCLSAGMVWRAMRYEKLAGQYERQQSQLYSQTFPGRPVAANVPLFLASEQQRLGALAGHSAEAPSRVSALLLLHDLLARLPADVRYRLTRIQIGDDRIRIEGETRSHGDANAIASAIRGVARFQIESPRTELTPQGIAFSISGVIVFGSAPGGARP